MKNASKQVDAYISKSPEFARPILTKLRQLFHKACPEIEETIKWGAPHFEYKGIVGSVAAFKQHVSYGFWKGSLLSDPAGLFRGVGNTSMCAAKVTALSELPPDSVLCQYIREAVKLNEDNVKPPPAPKRAKRELVVPDDLTAALKKNKKALATFEAFSPSHQREYVEWITEAKREETRQRRLATTIEWLAQGKPHNWKYMEK